MKKRITRWLALLMAVAMLITSAIYTSGIATVPESALKAAEEQLAEEGKLAATTGEAQIEAPEASQTEVPEVTEPQPTEEVVQIPAEQPVEVQQEVPEEVRYTLTFHKPDVEGGTIHSWTIGDKTDITNGYTEEVTENTVYNMEVTATDKYEVEMVTDQYQNIIQPKSIEGKVYFYEIPVTENMELRVTYKEIAEVTEEPEAADTAQKDEAKQPEADKTDAAKTDENKDASKTEEETKADPKKTDEATDDSKNTDDSKDSAKKAEESTDEKAESDKMPEMEFEEVADGITVIVNAPEGAFPAGTVMKVKAISDEAAKAYAEQVAGKGKEVTGAKAVDITFYNKKGEEIQPKVPVKVELLNTGVEGEEKGVFRKNSDDSVEKIASGGESSSGTAFEAEHFTIYGDFGLQSTAEESEGQYLATSDGLHITLHGTPYGDLPAYCYNESRSFPAVAGSGKNTWYKKLVRYEGQEGHNENAVRNLLYAGDPFDGLGIRKLASNDMEFHISTQNALWVLLGQRGQSIIEGDLVGTAIHGASEEDNIPQPGELIVNNKSIKFTEEKLSTASGYRWVYRTDLISLSGYSGEYTLTLPSGIHAYDSQGTERDTFSTIESFYLEAESEEALLDLIKDSKLTMQAGYRYSFPGEIYYAEAVDNSYQNLLCYTTQSGSKTTTFTADVDVTSRKGYYIYYTLNGDKEIVHEIQIDARDSDDFLQQFDKGKIEYTKNNNVKDYCDANSLDYTKFQWDEEVTYINNQRAIYLNFNASEKVKVIFDSQGGIGDFADTVELPYGGNLLQKETESRKPSIDHYEFTGWYAQREGGEQVTYLSRVIRDTTLYAQYAPAQYDLTVKIDGTPVEKYAQTKGYNESFVGDDAVYTVDNGYYITNVKITGGSNGDVKKEYTSSDKELGEYAEKFTLPSINKATENIDGDCLVEITTVQKKSMTVGADNVIKTYDGKKYGVTAKINGTVPADAKIWYYNATTKKYDLEESPAYKDVKLNKNGKVISYTVKFRATAPGYNAAEGQATVTINPRELTVKADDHKKDYGTDDPALTYSEPNTQEQLVDGETAGYTGSLKRDEGTAVGIYPIKQNTLKLKDNGAFKAKNYKLEFIEGKLTIKGKLVLNTNHYKGEYDGTYHDLPEAEAKASENTVNPIIEYSRNNETWSSVLPNRKDVTVNEPGGAETIYVRAYVEDSEYYDMVTGTATFTITQATLTVTAESKLNLPYGTPIGKLTGTIAGFKGNDTEANSIAKGTPNYTTEATDTSDAGEYDIKTDVSSLKSVNENYLFEPVDGKITIIPLADVLQISAAGNEAVYDSENHTLKSFVVKGIGNKVLAAWDGKDMTVSDSDTKLQYRVNDSQEWQDTLPEFVDAGTYQVNVKAENKNYKESVQATAEVVVSRRPVQIQVDNSQKNFKEPDPEPDPVFTGAVTDQGPGTGFTQKDARLIDISYSRTNNTEHKAGTYPKVLTAEISWDSVKKDNYEVTILPGDFVINPSGELSFIPETVQQTYNGESLAASASANFDDAKIEYSMDGTNWKDTIEQKDVPASDDNTYYVHVRVSKEGYQPKQSDPNKKDTMAKIIINPATILVTAPNQKIAFEERDSLELSYTNEGAVKEEEPGFKGNLALDKEIVSIGDYKIQLNDLVLADNAETGFKKSNYRLLSELGTVTVTGTLALTAEDYEGIYDGKMHSAEIINATSSDGSAVGVQYSLDGARWQQEEISYKDVPGNSTDTYTYYVRPYAEKYPDADATLVSVTIHPAVVAVTPESFAVAFTDPDKDSKLNDLKYDAEIQDDKGNPYVTGETPQFSGKLQKEYGDRVGSYPVTRGALALKDSEDETFKASNYILKVGEGNVRITGELHLDLTAYNEDYDAGRHTIETVASADDSREELLVQFSKNGTDWSTEEVFRKNVTADGPVTVHVKVEAKNNENYEAVNDSANIIINPVPLIIKADDVDDIIYGTEIPTLTGSYVSGLVGEDTLEDALTNANGLADGSYTTDAKVGSSVGSYEITAAKGKLASHNYELLFRPGTLNIVQAENLNVSAVGNDVIYDAGEHTLTDVKYTGGEDTKLEYSTDGGNTWQSKLPQYTEVGEYPVLVKAENPNYSNTPTAEATVIIRPKDVTIQVADSTKVYGTDDPVFTGTVSGLVNEDDLGTIVYSRDPADVDKEEVGDDITVTATYGENKNYHIIVIPGKLEITPVGTLNVTVTDTEVVYDGNEYGVVISQTPGSTPLYSTDGENWSEIPPEFTEVGEYEVYVKVVQDGYTDSEVVTGKVTIHPREIVITAASAEKTYDGTELIATSASLTSGSLAVGEEITSITVRGSQTEVGSSPNVASDVVIIKGERNVTGNYSAQYADGTLTVRAAQTAVIPPITTITPPTTPTTPVAPITPPTPGTPVTVAAAGVTVTPLVNEPAPDVNAPAQAEGTDNGYDLTEIADTETPLANTNLDDHVCCILHFLLMLATLLVTILYTRSMKKRQKRFFELQEEYELELIRRDLEKYEDDTESVEIA